MSSLNEYVDKIFYINMDADTQRREHLLSGFSRHGIHNSERIPGIEPTPEQIKTYNFFGPFGEHKDDPEVIAKYKKGSTGCLLSHQKAIQLAKERGYTKICILEDDIAFDSDFEELFSKYTQILQERNMTFDIFYLSLANWTHCNGNVPDDKGVIHVCSGGHNAYAYILDAKCFDIILANIEYCRIEIDLLYNNLNMHQMLLSYTVVEDMVHVQDFGSNIRTLAE